MTPFIPWTAGVLLTLAAAWARGALVPGTAEKLSSGSLSDAYPEFIGAAFMNGAVPGTLKAANFNGNNETLSATAAGTVSVQATPIGGLPWLVVSAGPQAPSTANSGTAVNFTGPAADQASRDRIGNTGFHGTNGWWVQLTGLAVGEKYRVQFLVVDGFTPRPGRNFDLLVNDTLAFDNFNPPGLGQAPFSAIAQFEAVAEANGTIQVSTAPGTTALSPDTNPYLCGLAVVQVNSDPIPPMITGQPVALTRGVGDPATLSVAVVGTTPFTFQWLRDGDPVAGATRAKLEFNAVTTADAGSYRCRITNAHGEALTEPATLTVFAPPTPLLAGLRGWWKFDETEGMTAGDASGFANHGTLVNFPASGAWVAGRTGGALQFRGSTGRDFVVVPSYLLPRETMTCTAWVWADARPSWASIAKTWLNAGASSLRFGLQETTGALSSFVQTAAGTQPNTREPIPLALGTWHHVACTADGSRLRLYRNGALVSSVPYTGSLATADFGPLGIGARLNSAGTAANTATPGYWQGKIDDLAIWARALSPPELSAIHQGGLLGLDLDQIDATPPAGGVVINEFMASNSGALRDEDGDSSDWIEIYNGTDTPVNLGGWSLTDAQQQPTRWVFPYALIGPRSFLLVYASEKNRAVAGQELHTNFRLGAEGEYLALHRPDASLACAFSPAYPAQVANVSFGLSSPDLSAAPPGSPAFTALLRYYQVPSPGYANGAGSPAIGPRIEQLTHAPAQPGDDDALTVSARLTPALAPVTNASLTYRVQFTPEVTIPMAEGANGIWSAVIPAAATPRQMIRYFVTAADSSGNSTRWPPAFDAATQPLYHGTVVTDPAITTPLPVLSWFLQTPAAAESLNGTRCSLFYGGEFYDNVFVRIRGGTSVNWPKKSYKLEFNDGHHFRFLPDAPRVSEIDLNTTYTDKSYVRAVLASDFMNAAGLPTVRIFHTHVRQNGAFYSLAHMTENPDRDHLRRVGLDPDGAYYKGAGGATLDSINGYEKKTRREESTADLQALVAGVALTGANLERFVFDHVDVPSMVNYMACMAISQDIDGSDKNHFLHRDTEGTREWRMLPWDIDLTFGPNALNTDTIVYNQQAANGPPNTSHPFIGARPYLLHDGKYMRLLEAIVKTPRARRMLLRRIRTLNDQFLAANYFQGRIDTLVPLITADVTADRAKWGANAHFPGTTYSLVQATNRIKNDYLARRPGYLTGATIHGVTTANPAAQPPEPTLAFGDVVFNPGTTQEEEFARLDNPNDYDVDISGWKIRGDIQWTFKPGTVIEPGGSLHLTPNAAAFRARSTSPRGGENLLVQGNYAGQLSARGGTLTLHQPVTDRVAASTTYAGAPSPLQLSLRISELMYHPVAHPDAEFIELLNTGSTTLDLAGAAFVEGVSFTFPSGPASSLAPGARFLVIKDAAAFASVYGARPPVAGEFLGSLDNVGERLHLVDPVGETILDFDYEDDWYPTTDGLGYSLVIVDPLAPHRSWDSKTNWRTTSTLGGSPGTDDAPPPLDSDGDGQSDIAEAAAGTDPMNASSRFEIISAHRLADGSVRLTFPAAANRAYHIQLSPDGISWSANTTIPADPNPRLAEITLPARPSLTEYFRVATGPASP
ncbi:MAG: CotH kinase family protein [Verrucomicrobiales bacterium]